MGFLKKLGDFFNAAPVKPIYNFSVRCNRCGETLTGRIDLHNEPSLDDDGKGYHVRKVLMGKGEQQCFNQVTVEMDFDLNHKLKSQEISGGTFIEA